MAPPRCNLQKHWWWCNNFNLYNGSLSTGTTPVVHLPNVLACPERDLNGINWHQLTAAPVTSYTTGDFHCTPLSSNKFINVGRRGGGQLFALRRRRHRSVWGAVIHQQSRLWARWIPTLVPLLALLLPATRCTCRMPAPSNRYGKYRRSTFAGAKTFSTNPIFSA